jgi:hypothetical protein
MFTVAGYKKMGGGGNERRRKLSATVPFIALSVLIALSLGAKQFASLATSRGRQFITGALAIWILVSFWIFG